MTLDIKGKKASGEIANEPKQKKREGNFFKKHQRL